MNSTDNHELEMKNFLILVSIFLMANVSLAGTSVPPDTIVAWFENDCYRPNQVKAFNTIIKYHAGSSYGNKEMITVKEEYDLTSIRNAFEGFVRSITVDYDPSQCSEYVTHRTMRDYEFDIYDEGDDYPSIGPQILSLYISWGFTADLFPIAEMLSYGYDWLYQALMWDKLGVGFFQYIESKVNTPDYRYTGCAEIYLKYMDDPAPDMVDACLSVIRTAAISSYIYQRMGAVAMMVELYVIGYSELRDDIIALQSDSKVEVRNAVNGDIQFQQEYGRMMDFPLPGE